MKLTKKVKITFLKCPKCGKLYFSPPVAYVKGREPKTESFCRKCNFKSADLSDWQRQEKDVLAFKCPKCGKYIENTSDNVSWTGVFREIVCPLCMGIVAINGKHMIKQETITEKDMEQSHKLDENLYYFEPRNKRQEILVRILNIGAMKEETSFKNMPRPKAEKSNVTQIVMLSEEKLMGYISFALAWKDNLPLVNQLYVVPEERRKGYATKVFQLFIEKYCDPASETLFYVESPNEKSYELITKKLGIGERVKMVCLG